jgi:hypothetical protein
LFWAGEHASSLANLQRRLLWHCGMDYQRQWRCCCHLNFFLLLLLICIGIDDEKAVLKVNRAEDEVELNLVQNQMLELNSGVFGTFFWELKLKLTPKVTQKR